MRDTRLAEIFSLLGTEKGKQFAEQARSYLLESRSLIVQAVINSEQNEVARLAHDLKGILFICGDDELEKLCSYLQSNTFPTKNRAELAGLLDQKLTLTLQQLERQLVGHAESSETDHSAK